MTRFAQSVERRVDDHGGDTGDGDNDHGGDNSDDQ